MVVDLSKTNTVGKKMLSVIKLEPLRSVVKRIGNPVRLSFGDSGVLLGPATGEKDNVEIDEADNVEIDEADNVEIDEVKNVKIDKEANVDIGLGDNLEIGEENNVDIGENMIVDVGNMISFSKLKEIVF